MCVAPANVRAAGDISLIDLIELDMGYTTLTDSYYRHIAPQRLLDGARVGLVAYLRGRGIADPGIGLMRARADGRGVVPAIEQQVGRVVARYGPRVNARELIYNAIRGEVGALHDPYSVFFTKTELSGFTAALDGRKFAGIGIVLARNADGHYRVDQVFDGSPAARAGLTAGDRIVSVDGSVLAGRDSAGVAGLLRGETGTTARLDVVRNDSGVEQRLAIVRAAITPPDVTVRVLPPAIGYLALRTFGPNAGAQVHAALAQLRTQGARSIVFDLRGNGGGYESSAVKVASAFVPSGPIVVTQALHGRRAVTSADGSALAALPLAVLVDGDSASGSELVTGAIQDHCVGTVVGSRTFGKGLVQTMFPLPDGSALKVTTARYFTPNGRDIDGVGITPDVVVSEPADAQHGVPDHDPQLDAARTLLSATAPGSRGVAPTTNR